MTLREKYRYFEYQPMRMLQSTFFKKIDNKYFWNNALYLNEKKNDLIMTNVIICKAMNTEIIMMVHY